METSKLMEGYVYITLCYNWMALDLCACSQYILFWMNGTEHSEKQLYIYASWTKWGGAGVSLHWKKHL